MTSREIFQKVKAHLLAQGRQSLHPVTNACAYRGKDGTMCAVGYLIKDEAYRPELEGFGVRNAGMRSALLRSGVEVSESLLVALQRIHDLVAVQHWPAEFDALEARVNAGEFE